MLKPIFISLSLLGIPSCVSTTNNNQPQDLYQTPAAMGQLVMTDNENNTSRCQATLVREDYILTGAHCYTEPNIVTAEFITLHPTKGEIRRFAQLPDAKKRKTAKHVSVFYQDAAVLALEEHIYDIAPLTINKTLAVPVNGLYSVSFPQPHGQADSVKGWQACYFDPQKRNPKLWLSVDCVLPKGYSGMPLLTYDNDQWQIVGMYHAFLISRDKVSGEIIKTFGAASPASSWDF